MAKAMQRDIGNTLFLIFGLAIVALGTWKKARDTSEDKVWEAEMEKINKIVADPLN